MRKIEVIIGRENPLYKMDVGSNFIKGVSNMEMHRADLIFIHQTGTEFQGKLMKSRFHPVYKSLLGLDELSSMFNHLPRKFKKAVKKVVIRQIKQYILNY